MEASEKEYTYLSMSGKYVVYFDVFRALFYRTLWQAGIKKPREAFSEEDREALLASYRTLKARPGLAECFDKLRDAGFKVWCLTSGDVQRVNGYLAAGGIQFPSENFVSCDTIGIGKPAPEVYKHVFDKFAKDGSTAWFAAAHMWDVSAARRTG